MGFIRVVQQMSRRCRNHMREGVNDCEAMESCSRITLLFLPQAHSLLVPFLSAVANHGETTRSPGEGMKDTLFCGLLSHDGPVEKQLDADERTNSLALRPLHHHCHHIQPVMFGATRMKHLTQATHEGV